MAFLWDDVQEKWLEHRLGPHAARFEPKVAVAGGSLEIDAVAEDAQAEPFFDFLTRFSRFENKAPSELFDGRDLLLLGARSLLFAHRRKLALAELAELTQVVLCARATEEVRREPSLHELRAGILQGRLGVRLVLVEANRLPVADETLPLLIRYASGQKLREAVEFVVDGERREHYAVLWFLRADIFKEVLAMKGKTLEENEIDIRSAVEELGIQRVVDSVGIQRVLEAIGAERVVETLGIERLKQLIHEIESRRAARKPDASS